MCSDTEQSSRRGDCDLVLDRCWTINLSSGTAYKQYPVNAAIPTGTVGDTGTDGFTFRVNAIYLRAKIDRSHLGAGAYSQVAHGRIDQILLNV